MDKIMRIFSLHKSKSKKQVSEKTPKLAANKFLEKRKVGTVIYLHEHPSGKIHGPYRKEYNKKIMKGGLDVFDFRVDRPQNNQIIYPPCLRGTNQLIIKRPRVGFLSNEPRIFFGDNHKIDKENNHYYTYVCKNNDYDINNLISFRKLEDSIGLNPPRIRELTLNEVKQIPPKILLGFYTQYIDRCKEPFQRRQIILRIIYMRRLFFYLFYHILPIITGYILTTYFQNIIIQSRNNIQQLINIPEIGYFINIVSFIKRINPVDIIDEICFTCNIPKTDPRIMKIMKEFKKSMNDLKFMNSLHQQNPLNQLRQSINNFQEITSSNPSAGIAHGMAMTGTLPNPIQVVQVSGEIINGIFKVIGAIGSIFGAFR